MEQGGDLLTGEVEADETYIGGKEQNKHASKKLHAGRGSVGKQAVSGMVERGGEVKAHPVGSTDQTTLHSSIRANVKQGAMLYTDKAGSYHGIDGYEHQTVVHSVGEYVRDQAHTNGVESFWALLEKRLQGNLPPYERGAPASLY